MHARQSLHGQSLGLHCSNVKFKAGSDSVDLVLSRISLHFLGAKYDNDSVPLYTDFTGLI